MQKATVYLTLASTAIVAAPLLTIVALTLQILVGENTATAGLLTLKFNLTNSLLDLPSPTLPPFRHRDLLQDIQNGAESLAVVAATRVSDAAGHVESAVSSAVAALPEPPQIQDYAPVNCTFSMYYFCVGFRHAQDSSCSDSPFDISALLPDAIRDLPAPVGTAFRERLGDLSPLADGLSRLPELVIVCLGVGLVVVVLMLGVFCYLAYVEYCTSRSLGCMWHTAIHLVMATACCAPYLALILLQRAVIEKAKGVRAWVQAERRETFGLSIGLFVCAAIFVVLSAILSSPRLASCLRGAHKASKSKRDPTRSMVSAGMFFKTAYV